MGVWSLPKVVFFTTKEMNIAPVAQFTVSPNPYPIGYESIDDEGEIAQALEINDSSYDPNGDPIFERSWSVERNGNEIYRSSSPPSGIQFDQWGEGTYVITLRVKDDPKTGEALWSEPYSQSLTVIRANEPPIIVTFEPNYNPIPEDVPLSFTYEFHDPQGYPINMASIQWRFIQLSSLSDEVAGDEPGWVYEKPPERFEEYNPSDEVRYFRIQISVENDPPYTQLEPMRSDWATVNLTVLPKNKPPVANFTIDPNPANIDDTITFTCHATDPEGLGLAERRLDITVRDIDGNIINEYSYTGDQLIQKTFNFDSMLSATDKLFLTFVYRVRDVYPHGDYGSDTPPPLWSEPSTQVLTLYPHLTGKLEVLPHIGNYLVSGAKFNYRVITSGYADKVTVEFEDSFFDKNRSQRTTDLPWEYELPSNHNKWKSDCTVDIHAKDGKYDVTIIIQRGTPGSTTVPYKRLVLNESVEVRGSVYDLIKIRGRDGW